MVFFFVFVGQSVGGWVGGRVGGLVWVWGRGFLLFIQSRAATGRQAGAGMQHPGRRLALHPHQQTLF